MVFYLNPALGLPPELPSTAPIIKRQPWWLPTVLATSKGMALILLTRPWHYKLTGLALLLMPHLVGAPYAGHGTALAPVDLARRYVFATTWTNGVFWLLLGIISASVFQRLGRV